MNRIGKIGQSDRNIKVTYFVTDVAVTFTKYNTVKKKKKKKIYCYIKTIVFLIAYSRYFRYEVVYKICYLFIYCVEQNIKSIVQYTLDYRATYFLTIDWL